MATTPRQIQDKGIYKSLPTYPPSLNNLTAIVTGANGISGFHTMRVLLESPSRWTKVWAASRRPPPAEMMDLLTAEQRERVEHVALDFLENPEEIARVLTETGVVADYVFFYSYAQPKPKPGAGAWSNAKELVEVNSALLRNFLEALPKANIEPKRFLLQTGAKNYGVHLGPVRTPCTESDPPVERDDPAWQNFYYPQQSLLYAYCEARSTDWNIIMPAWIIGATTNAAMNALHPLAVYAAVQAHKNQPLAYPGTLEAWQALSEHSTAKLTGHLSEWAVLTAACANQKFNASDSSPLPRNRLWPELARWYGTPGSEGPELDEAKITTLAPPPDTPTPLGYGPPAKTRFHWTLSAWAEREENHAAWRELMQNHGLTHDPFEAPEEHFVFGDAAAWGLGTVLSMNKARYFGWTGFVDTRESLFQAYGELARLGMLPPMVVGAAEPLI
ncbi:hypothetical protein MBLNU230_g5828t1 [Neophaeotheca triangularis]